ncbi:MAG: DUF3089 domain-containing protein [Lachnospiraceae bacterium]|nr:DUF3089 domain-containing protein [Lachnospiraceae bacterium]
MKKNVMICLICAIMLLSFSGCNGVDLSAFYDEDGIKFSVSGVTSDEPAAPEEASDDLLVLLDEVNNLDVFLDRHERLTCTIKNTAKDGTNDDWSFYADDKRYVAFYGWGTEVIEDNEVYGIDETYDPPVPFRRVFIDNFDAYAEDTKFTDYYSISGYEKIISKEVKDGLIYLKTCIPGEFCWDSFSYLGYSKDEVDELIEEYVIDEGSLEIRENNSYISQDGEMIFIYGIAFDTDCDEYIPEKELTDAVFAKDDIRTDTVIVDAGTDNEKTFTQTIRKGGIFSVCTGNEFCDALYTDPECLTKTGETDKTKDITVYLKRKVDYSEEENWAYFKEGEDRAADLFLIAPTVDTNDEFVMSLDDNKTKENFLGALNMERGIYEADTRMYAPYYRQAAMKVYSMTEDEREPYLEYAYDDISEAFRYYLENENNGRPIVLAGFSQGADMCYRLLKDYFGDEELYDRLVAVYAIGWPCTEEMAEEFPQIKPAVSETDTGVVVSFDCEAPEVNDTFITPAGTKAFTINPLNWKTDSTPADKEENLGACFTDYGGNITNEINGLCGCYIDEDRGIVKVPDVDASDYPAIVPGLPEGSYHIYDYQFFFRNLEKNVHDRTESYLGAEK